MTRETRPLHWRILPGIDSWERTAWNGAPLKASYLLEYRLSGSSIEPTARRPAVLLVPGGWDVAQGDYSARLIRDLLESGKAPVVFELHFRLDGRDGDLDPELLVTDIGTIYANSQIRPFVTSLCGGCLMALEPLVREPLHYPAALLLVGPAVDDFLNTAGRLFLMTLTVKVFDVAPKYLKFSGHPYTHENARRFKRWCPSTAARRLVHEVDPSTRTRRPWPMPIRELYFARDIMTQEGRARLRRAFDIPYCAERVQGRHRGLQEAPEGDRLIVEFYRQMSRRSDAELEPSQAGFNPRPSDVAALESTP